MNYTFGLIGCGNMGSAVARAVSQVTHNGILANRTPQRAQKLAEQLSFSWGSNTETAEKSRFLFLGVKPHLMSDVLQELQPVLAARETKPILVSMAAGLTISQLEEMAGGTCPVIRIMPNTPVSVGQGVILYDYGNGVQPEDETAFLELLAQSGRLVHLSESFIDAGTAISGCGPAFAYLLIDAMADGGVACGLPRADALQLAAQTLLGSAQMVMETGKHPEQLKNEVCSPGGSTIQGVRTLEQRSVRAAMMDAVIAACEKSAALGKG